jgi:hypothetical protein
MWTSVCSYFWLNPTIFQNVGVQLYKPYLWTLEIAKNHIRKIHAFRNLLKLRWMWRHHARDVTMTPLWGVGAWAAAAVAVSPAADPRASPTSATSWPLQPAAGGCQNRQAQALYESSLYEYSRKWYSSRVRKQFFSRYESLHCKKVVSPSKRQVCNLLEHPWAEICRQRFCLKDRLE